MEGPPLAPGGEDITWPDQVAPRGRKASSTRKIKPQTSNLSAICVTVTLAVAPAFATALSFACAICACPSNVVLVCLCDCALIGLCNPCLPFHRGPCHLCVVSAICLAGVCHVSFVSPSLANISENTFSMEKT